HYIFRIHFVIPTIGHYRENWFSFLGNPRGNESIYFSVTPGRKPIRGNIFGIESSGKPQLFIENLSTFALSTMDYRPRKFCPVSCAMAVDAYGYMIGKVCTSFNKSLSICCDRHVGSSANIVKCQVHINTD